ncbi:MAG: hypothetical protein WBI17_07250 [Clostridiaceae bacterium]
MKIALINGSPKMKKSASEYILTSLKSLLPDELEFSEFKFNFTSLSNADLIEITDSDLMIFAFPLYVDGIPSHLLRCLHQLETYLNTNKVKKIRVYAIVNCGFYEGHQARIALDLMKNWCSRARLEWGQGIGIGGGGFLASFEGNSKDQGPLKSLWDALKNMAVNIAEQHENENIYTVPNFPKLIYTLGGNMGWHKQIKENGLRRKDIYLKK